MPIPKCRRHDWRHVSTLELKGGRKAHRFEKCATCGKLRKETIDREIPLVDPDAIATFDEMYGPDTELDPDTGRPRQARPRCPDCGLEDEIKGHMACQYPQDDGPPSLSSLLRF